MPRFISVNRTWVLPLLAVLAVTPLEAQSSANPFLPPSSAAPSAANANAPYSLTGMTVVGKDTLLGITRTSDKRSVWVPVGKSVGEITAISYDPQKDQAVIRVNDRLETVTMKKSAVVTGAPATNVSPAVPTPSPSAALQPPVDVPTTPMSAQEEKEMEARMLVTDLLEIGQRQRKAYEEAQRQAAARNAGKAPVPPATPSKP